MVRFCRNCKKALDDTDKFCRECGKDTTDSITYQDFYNLVPTIPTKDDLDNGSDSLQESSLMGLMGEAREARESRDESPEVNKLLDNLLPKEDDKNSKLDKRLLINKNRGAESVAAVTAVTAVTAVPAVKAVPAATTKTVEKKLMEVQVLSFEDEKKISRKRKKYKCYEKAISGLIPGLIKDIDNSKDGMIRVKVSDVVKKMGGGFERKSLPSIFFGLKYVLFGHGLWIRVGTLKDDSKMFIIRRKDDGDKLPPSLNKQRRRC